MSEFNNYNETITANEAGNILFDAVRKIDNWDPCTCQIDALLDHLADVERIEGFVSIISDRANFLRGVLSARTLHEVMSVK